MRQAEAFGVFFRGAGMPVFPASLCLAFVCLSGCGQSGGNAGLDATVDVGVLELSGPVDALQDADTDVTPVADAAPADATDKKKDAPDADALDAEVALPIGCPPDPTPSWAPPITGSFAVAPPPGRQCALPGWPAPMAAKPLAFTFASGVLALPMGTQLDRCMIWQDLDGDGLEDLTFLIAPDSPIGGRKLVIARGQPNGTLKVAVHGTKLMGQPFDCAVADLEHDGHPELLVTTLPGLAVLELTGAKVGSLANAKFLPGVYPFGWSVSVTDLTGDGVPDVYLSTNLDVGIQGKYVCGNADAPYVLCCLDVASAACMQTKAGASDLSSCCVGAPPPSPHVVLRNQAGVLVDDSAKFAVDTGAGMTVTPHDIDRDGHTDLFIGDDFGQHGWFINRGDGFAPLKKEVGMRPYAHIMGSVVADFDGDHRDDLLVTDWGPATLYHATAAGFEDASATWGVWPDTIDTVNWAAFAEDWDRDGSPDYAMTVSSATTPGKVGQVEDGDSSIFLPGYHLVGQNQGGHFAVQKLPWPNGLISDFTSPVGVAGDYDHDGDLDLFFTYGTGEIGVWRNDTPQGNHWLNVHAVDGMGPVLGALVQVWAQGHVQELQVLAATGWGAKHAPVARFGLGSVEKIDLVRVWWPSGKITDLPAPAIDQDLTVKMP